MCVAVLALPCSVLAQSTSPAPPARDVAGGIEPPRAQGPLTVDYPPGASGQAIVELALTIDADGFVRSATATRGEEPFTTAARERATGWTFAPARREGKPIASVIRVEVRFTAPEASPTETAPPATSSEPPSSPSEPRKPTAPVEVVIRGVKPSAPSVSSLARAEVRQLPGAFGDPFRAVEAMPGVTPIVSGLPYFFIRGAPPGNVGYFLDGVRVPLLYHFALGPSVVHPALIERVDLYSGGYPARYGGYAGAIVAGETTAPADKPRGEGNIRLFDAGALVETPFAGERGAALVGGRYSYTAFLVSQFAPNTIVDYWDYQTRVSYDLAPHDRVTGFLFGSYDLAAEKRDGTIRSGASTEFHRADLRYDHDFGGEERATRFAVTLGYDRTRSFETLRPTPFVRDRSLAARNQTTYRLSDDVLLRAGADATLDVYDVSFDTGDLPDVFATRRDLALAAYAEVTWKPAPRVEVTPGLRGAFYASKGGWAAGLDPRLSGAFAISDKVRLLHAYGIAQQLPSFVIPIPGFQIADVGGGLQWAFQASAGVEASLPAGFTLTTNVFHNAFFNMTDALATQTMGNSGSDDALSRRTRGSAVGLEVWVRRRLTERLGGFLTYTLSRSVRNFDGQTLLASFDRTHVLNVALAYDLGRNWRAGTRLVWYSGRPRDPFVDNQISTFGSASSGSASAEAHPISYPIEGRLPGFYRIDVRLEKKWRIGESGWISFVIEGLNATLQKEIVSETCDTFGGTVSGGLQRTCHYDEIGPVTVPSIGVEGGF